MLTMIFVILVLCIASGFLSCLLYRYFQNKHTYTKGVLYTSAPDENGKYNWVMVLEPSDIPDDTEFVLLTVVRE